ncbi:MAG: TonB-dependent receptor [Sphingobium sp.]
MARHWKWGIGIASLAMSLVSPPVLAQDSDLAASTPVPTGDIIVTARRRAESLQDVPVAVTAVTQQDLEQRSTRGIEDVAQIAPNLNIGQATRGAGVATVNMRGQENTGQAITNDPAVGIYFDEVYLGRSAGNLLASILDMSSVEVLRGPQGTLFGRNNTGGAILLTPNRPTLSGFSGSVLGSYGSFDEVKLQGTADIALVDDKLGVRGSFELHRRDGIGRSITTGNDNYGDRHRESGRLGVRWRPADTITLDFTYDFTDIKETGQVLGPLTPFPGLGFYDNRSGLVSPSQEAHIDGYTLRTEIEATPDLGFKLIIGRRLLTTDQVSDVDQTPAASVDVRQFADQNQWTFELQASGTTLRDAASWLSSVDFTGGVFYFDEDGSDSSLLPVPVATLFGTGRTLRNYARNQSAAAYLQIESNHFDRLFFTAGARYTKDERELTIQTGVNGACGLAALPVGTPIDLCKQSASADFSYWSYSLGSRFKINDDANVYVKFDRGQRAGGLDDTPRAIVPFRPEVVTSLEAGLKLSLLDRRLRANLAIFRMKVGDLQRSVLLIEPTTGSPYSSVFNAAKSRVQGFEAEVNLTPVDGLTLGGSLGLIDADYTRFTNPATGADQSSFRFPNTPKKTYSLSASYDAPITDTIGMLARIDYAYRSKLYFDVFNDPRAVQNGYGVLNGRIQLNIQDVVGKQVSLAVFGRNLTDRHYSTYATTAAGGQFVRNETPRTIGVELKTVF